MKANIVEGMLARVDGNQLTISREGYQDFVASSQDVAVNDEAWVLEMLGRWVKCKVVDGVIREVEAIRV